MRTTKIGIEQNKQNQNVLSKGFDEENGKTQTWFFEMKGKKKKEKQEQVKDFEERALWGKKQPEN